MRCSAAVLDAVMAHARSAEPAECCGILLGAADRIVAAMPSPNLSGDPNRFIIDPRAHIAARRSARAGGVEVVGFYHSHPHSEPAPSPSDIAEVTYDGCLYLIVSPDSEPAARLFRMDPDGPTELDLTLAPS
jgi:proteasome lid subunit RPN8/RPN11